MTQPRDLTIRPARPADAEALTALHLDCWDEAYTGLIPQEILDARRHDVAQRVESWRKIAAKGGTLIAEYGGEPIGFASSGPPRDEDLDLPIELYALYVRAGQWGTGVGHALLDRAVGDSDCSLWVLEANARATTFYLRHGFRADGQALDEPEGRHLRMIRNERTHS